MAQLNVNEAQRKAMLEWMGEVDPDDFDYEEWLDGLFAAANSIPEGAPVGTIARRPDGAWIGVRREDYWAYRNLVGLSHDVAELSGGPSVAESWPVIYDPTKRGPEIPPLGFFPGELPDPTDHPSREELQEYFHKDLAEHCQADDPDEYPDEYHEGDKPRLERLMREPSVFDGDADEVEELAKWLSIHLGTWPEEEWGRRVKPNYYHDRAQELLDFGYRKVSDPTAQQEPAYTAAAASEEMAKYWDNSIVTTTKREPRVVDRLGVDEQGSRWRDENGLIHSFTEGADGGRWKTQIGGSWYPWAKGVVPHGGEYTEILEPRVLPSLDCEEARDGTEWKFRLNGEPRSLVYRNNGWRYGEVGDRIGGRCGVSDGHAFIREFAPYIEVVGDPS